jgi:hypothetical protein
MANKEETIPCSFLDIPEYEFCGERYLNKKRKGKYSKTVYPIEGYGVNYWVFVAYIITEVDFYLKQGLSEEDILNGCINYFNIIPERKKYEKKIQEPLFGKLKLLSFRLKEKNNVKCFVCEIITDKKENKYLWGEGVNFNVLQRKRKRKH